MYSSVYKFILRYKILHIIFWIWVTISLAHELQASNGKDFGSSLQYAIIMEFFAMASVYFTLYFLTPRYFNKQKYFQFVIFSLLAILVTSVLATLAENVFAMYVVNEKLPRFSFARILSRYVDTTVKTLAFVAVVVIQTKIETDYKNKRLEKERLEAELKFLKAQMNPHFMFNALNSIYVLIDENKKLAGETLLKFSELLRYQLYECSDSKTTIKMEMEFIRNYIEMEKLRYDENVKIDFEIQRDISQFALAPFILIPFVENAFKHLSNYPDKINKVNINAGMNENVFHFSVCNSFEEGHSFSTHTHGIGLQNVKRRLELLYPGAHSLEFTKQYGMFHAYLKLYTNENELSHH